MHRGSPSAVGTTGRVGAGGRPSLTTTEQQRVPLERDRELPPANEICGRQRRFRPSRSSTAAGRMVAFIDTHLAGYGLEPICAQLPIAPSTYYEVKARQADPTRVPPCTQRDAQSSPRSNAVARHSAHVWCEEGVVGDEAPADRHRAVHSRASDAALGLRGVVRGRRVKTTLLAIVTGRPQDLVERNFTATRPNQLWVADPTYIAT